MASYKKHKQVSEVFNSQFITNADIAVWEMLCKRSNYYSCGKADFTKNSPALLQLLLNKYMDLQPSASSKDQGNFKRPLVLAVDDNEDNLQLLTQLLVLIGCSYIAAANGQTTLVMAQNYQPDLILLDIMLPDLNGIDIARSLKQDPKTAKIPVIAVTAMARTEDQEQFLLAGCTDCVTKPYMIDHLSATIRRYVCTNSF